MSTAVVEPPAERVEHPTRMIANVPGRLGPWAVNVIRARVGVPWKRRLSAAALFIPRIRYWEKQYLELTDEKLLATSMALRGKARGKYSLDKLLPEAFGLCSVSIQRPGAQLCCSPKPRRPGSISTTI